MIPPGGVEKVYVNLNDGTLEGFRHPTKPIMTVQHHPEAAAGPTDSRTFFADYKAMVMKARAGK